MKKRNHQRNIWLDLDFIEVLREIKREKSARIKKDLSDADISKMIIETPAFEEVKKQLLMNEAMHIGIRMDRKRR